MGEVTFLEKLVNGIIRWCGLCIDSFSKNHMKKRNMQMIPDLVQDEIIEAGYRYEYGKTIFFYDWQFKKPDFIVEIAKVNEDKKVSSKLELENKINDYVSSIWGEGYEVQFGGSDKRNRLIRLRLTKEF